jgi:hypothetical protein
LRVSRLIPLCFVLAASALGNLGLESMTCMASSQVPWSVAMST